MLTEAMHGFGLIGFESFVVLQVNRGALKLVAGRHHPTWWPYAQERGYNEEVPKLLSATGGWIGPTFYSDLENSDLATPRMKEIAEERRAFGINEGFVKVRHQPHGQAYLAALVGSDVDSEDPDVRAAAHVLSSYFMSATIRLFPDVSGGEEDIVLTARQLECLRWVRHGKSSTDIGDILSISANTVNEHVAQACARLGVRTRIQAVARAIELGLIDP